MGMNSYFSIEQQQILRAGAYIKIAIAWFLGALAIWLWANQPDFVKNFFYVYCAFVFGVKMLGLFGWAEFAKSKGYAWATGFLSFLPIVGPGMIVFLDDRWAEQQPPKLKVRRMSW